LLFCHDEEIVSQFQAQVYVMTQHISSLEEKLRNCDEDCDFVRNQLYESEIARYNEAHSKVAFQRHLRLEQHRNNSGAEAYRALQLQHGKTVADLDAVNTLNAMLQQEIKHSQHIIDSMARKIAEYERSAQRLAGSQQDDRSKASSKLETGFPNANANAAAGSPGSLSPGTGGAHVFVNESPHLSSTGLGTEPQKRLLNRERKAKRLGKTKAGAKVEK
jgi:hypothetical protein